jgi:hypothetical protein
MTYLQFFYPAVRVSQSKNAPPIIFFAAPCPEMAEWAGIPQKKRFGESTDQETVGFQRQENKNRINELLQFYSEPKNVIQNPILCAARSLGATGVRFEALTDDSEGPVIHGKVVISVPDFSAMTMGQLFEQVRQQLEKRVPDLLDASPSLQIIDDLKRKINLSAGTSPLDMEDHESQLEDEVDSDSNDTTVALFEESHITDFWEEIAARHEISKLLVDNEISDPFLGFSRELLISYLQPTVVVDGQHRLKGAIAHARNAVNESPFREMAEDLIEQGKRPDEIDKQLMAKAARILPVSLLLSDDPAEQVFQFVVVNQKATPIGKALLGTIVSTTLGQNELDKVSGRLKRAGIPLEESRALSLVVRSKGSPFFGKVQRGIDSNNGELLEWNVLGQLISIFKNLEGGRLYGENNDYAELWRRKFLDSCEIINDYAAKGFSSPKEYWSSTDGPWLTVFTKFWQVVRTRLSSEDPEEPNFWGAPRKSNLFNKIILTILTADFFLYLTDKDKAINSVDDVEKYATDWLHGVSENYFKRDWELSGVKKDTTGIKKRWSSMWKEYRKNPIRLPVKTQYRQALS